MCVCLSVCMVMNSIMLWQNGSFKFKLWLVVILKFVFIFFLGHKQFFVCCKEKRKIENKMLIMLDMCCKQSGSINIQHYKIMLRLARDLAHE